MMALSSRPAVRQRPTLPAYLKEDPAMKRIITIGREFGAGGGELGRRLARELDIAYYDRDII